jgi:hypothetical protein
VIAHWDEVERARVDWKPAAAAWWTDLGRATGASGVGSCRARAEPGSPIRSAPTTAARPTSPTAPESQSNVCRYPRSNKIFWRGVGLIARLEPLDYDDGEPEE